MKFEFITDDQQRFLKHFQLYLINGDSNEYIIDLDDTWEWMGFLRKDAAKRVLTKNFENNADFIIKNLPTTNVEQHGGHNKQNILMTINTFKSLCMLSSSKKGKETRKYYLKLEKCFIKYMKDKHMQTIENMQKENKINLEKQRHNDLKIAYKDKPCIYLVKISHDVDDMVVKLGETDDVSQRIISLQQEYKVECTLLEVFPCERPHKFEQYLLNVPDIKSNRIMGSELIQLSSNFTYDFDNTPIQYKLQLAKSKERIELMNLISKSSSDEEKSQYIKLLEMSYTFSIHEEPTEKYTEPQCSRRVYKYNLDDLSNPIEEFHSLREAARSLGDSKVHDYNVRMACMNNTELCGYRWFCVDTNISKDSNQYTIPPTQHNSINKEKKNSRRKGLIAQLNMERNMILNVYHSLKEAANSHNIAPCSITCAMNKDRNCNDFYWKMYDDCDETLRKTFTGKLPNIDRLNTCSKQVQRIDPDTFDVLKTYKCIQDICTEYRICHKTIHKIVKNGTIYKGFKWMFV